VRNAKKAQNALDLASTFDLLSPQQQRLIQVVQYDLEQPETIPGAIGNAGKVVAAIGAGESNAGDVKGPYRVDGEGAKELIKAGGRKGHLLGGARKGVPRQRVGQRGQRGRIHTSVLLTLLKPPEEWQGWICIHFGFKCSDDTRQLFGQFAGPSLIDVVLMGSRWCVPWCVQPWRRMWPSLCWSRPLGPAKWASLQHY
jgi:hypothetical protein